MYKTIQKTEKNVSESRTYDCKGNFEGGSKSPCQK